MAADSKIAWTHHTFNPWWGCTKVSAGCTNCYAETFAKRTGNKVWGDAAERRLFLGEKHWTEPLKWAKAARAERVRQRVFCASMADVFEDRPELVPHRHRLWDLIGETLDVLDWLLLTKRPENIARLGDKEVIAHCWLGTTTENQEAAAKRLPELLKHDALVHFASAEPLLESVNVMPWLAAPTGHMLDWVIVGGESGPKSRPFNLEWARELIEQCERVGAACFVKQLGVHPVGTWADDAPWPERIFDSKGGEPEEWPTDLRVREFPEVHHG